MGSKWVKIGDICNIKHGYAFKSELFSKQPTANIVVTPGNFKKGGGFQYTSRVKYYKGKPPEEFILRSDDLIVTMTDLSQQIDTLGYSALVPNDSFSYLHNQRIGLVEITSKKVDKHYLYWLMRSSEYQRTIANNSTGSTVHHTSPRLIMEYEFLLPEINEQRRIANILDCLDLKIEFNSRINDYLEELTISIYSEELGWREDDLPNGWEFRPLSDFFPIITGKKDANIATKNGSYPFFTCKQASLLTDTYSFEGSAILVAGNGDFNVKWYEGQFEAYQRTYVLMPDSPALLGYLYCAVKRNLSEITSGSRGSVIRFITKGNIADYKIAVPPNPEQNWTIMQLRLILKLIDAYNREITKLETLRDTLLSKLMSGEIDVSKIDLTQLNNHLCDC